LRQDQQYSSHIDGGIDSGKMKAVATRAAIWHLNTYDGMALKFEIGSKIFALTAAAVAAGESAMTIASREVGAN
jgi:hypothetical protein